MARLGVRRFSPLRRPTAFGDAERDLPGQREPRVRFGIPPDLWFLHVLSLACASVAAYITLRMRQIEKRSHAISSFSPPLPPSLSPLTPWVICATCQFLLRPP